MVKTVNILGTEYRIEVHKRSEDEFMRKNGAGIAENFEIQYDFAEYDKIEIEFVETEPHNRIHVNYISLGSETAYKLEYDDLYSTWNCIG